nr:hypothetical protein Itr_chr06CG17370 [Ipomoea trifida]
MLRPCTLVVIFSKARKILWRNTCRQLSKKYQETQLVKLNEEDKNGADESINEAAVEGRKPQMPFPAKGMRRRNPTITATLPALPHVLPSVVPLPRHYRERRKPVVGVREMPRGLLLRRPVVLRERGTGERN